MPIRINLLAEQQLAEEVRRRDPVKRALWLAGFVVAVVLIWSLGLWLKGLTANVETRGLEARWRTLERTNSNVTTNLHQTREAEQKIEALTTLAASRVLWAPFLDAMQFSLADNIQLVSLRTRQTYLQTPEVKPKGTVKGKPASNTEKITLTIEGRDYGPTSGEQIDLFKRKLLENAYLKRFITNENSLRLTARAQPQADPADSSRSFVLFTLEGLYPEVTR